MAWTNQDFGEAPTGSVITAPPANGVELLVRRLTVFLVPCTCQLPSPIGHPIELWVLNRSNGLVSVKPGPRDKIEGGAVDDPLDLAPDEESCFWLIDNTNAASPRTWWSSVQRVLAPDAAKAARATATQAAEHQAALAAHLAEAEELRRRSVAEAIDGVIAAVATLKKGAA